MNNKGTPTTANTGASYRVFPQSVEGGGVTSHQVIERSTGMDPWTCDSQEDDWYYASLRRYGKLIMFEIEDAVQQIELSDCSSICVLSKKKSGQCIISELLLPSKLKQIPQPLEGLVKDRDLKIKSGTYVDANTSQIVAQYGEGTVFASQEGIYGVSQYKLGCGESDKFSKSGNLHIPIHNPKLDLNGNLLLMSKYYSEPAFVVDTKSEGIVYRAVPKPCEVPVPSGLLVVPIFLSADVFGLCQESTGTVILRDTRQESVIGKIDGCGPDSCSHWTMATDSSSNCQNLIVGSSSHKIGLLSNEGHLKIYDTRNLKSPETFSELQFNLRPDTAGEGFYKTKQLRFGPSKCHKISISGFDENVYIYDVIGDSVRNVFVHDGHAHTENCDKETLTTSHIWYEPGGDSVLISGATNDSINCWQYNAENPS